MTRDTNIPKNWVIYAVSDNRQDIAFSRVVADPAWGCIGVATPNFANLTIKKDFEYDGENVDKDKAIEYTESVSFTIRTNVSGTDYYVQAIKNKDNNWVFNGTTTKPEEATKITITDPDTHYNANTGEFSTTIYDIPAEAAGRDYVVREYVKDPSALTKDGYPAYNDTNVKEEEVRITGYNTSSPTTNAGTVVVTFTNTKDADYTGIGLRKYKKDPDSGASENASGTFVSCVYYNNKLYYLKNLDTVSTGKYKIPNDAVSQGSFANNSYVLTTDITEAQKLKPGSAGIQIDQCPIGIKFGFIEIQSELENNTPLNGYGDDVVSNKVNMSDFASTVSKYTKETDGIVVIDTSSNNSIFGVKGREFPFTFGVSSASSIKRETLYNYPYYVDVTVHKEDDEGHPLEGATIGLYKNGEEIERQTTGSNGNVTFEYTFDPIVLEADGYTYKEISAPSGYKKDTKEYKISFRHIVQADISGTYGSTYAHLTSISNLPEIVNYPYKGEIHLLKSEGDTEEPMEGISFDITSNKDLTAEEIANIKVANGQNVVKKSGNIKAGEVIMTVNTDAKGLIDIYELPVGKISGSKFEYTYTATEKNMPKGMYGEGPYTFEFFTSNYSESRSSVLGGAVVYADADATNFSEPIQVKVIKKDNHNKPLADVEFKVIADEDVVINGKKLQSKDEVVGSFKTDSKGEARNYTYVGEDNVRYTFKVYGGFKYRIEESSVPDGIVLDTTAKTFTAPFDESGDVEEFTYTKVNRWYKAKINLIKLDSKTREALDGAAFEIWKDADNNDEFDTTNDVKLETIVAPTRVKGEYETPEELEYGTYFVKETTAPEGYVKDPNAYKVSIDEDGKTVTVGNHTDPDGKVYFFEDEIKGSIELIKKDIDTQETLSGAEFTVYVDSNKNGVYDEGEAEYGKMTEKTATDDNGNVVGTGVYTIDEVPYGSYVVKETVAPKDYKPDEGDYPAVVTVNKEKITVRNTDGDTTFVDQPMKGGISLLKYDKDYPDNKLSGAEFEVYKDNNLDGTIDDNDTFVGNLIEGTDEDAGTYSLSGLRMGQYLVKETVAPKDFDLDPNTYIVVLAQDGQVAYVENEAGKGFANSPSLGSITLTKYDSRYPDHKLSGAVFDVWKDIDGDGEVDEEDVYLGVLEEAEEGIYIMTDLRIGDYIVHEKEAPEGFNLDEGYYPAHIIKSGDVFQVVNREEDGDFASGFYNDVIRGSVNITKTDLTTSEGLPNTGIRIYNEDKEVIAEGYTDDEGHLVFENLDYGTYFFQEYDAPEGYVINESLFEFKILENGKTVEAEMTNKPITGDIIITKTDIATSDTLPNTGIALYKEDGTLIEKKYTDENGQVEFKELRYGKYYFVEFDAPEGYELNTEKHWFEITEDGKVIKDTISDVPKTGVENNMVIPMMAAAVSAMGLAAITITAIAKKRREE